MIPAVTTTAPPGAQPPWTLLPTAWHTPKKQRYRSSADSFLRRSSLPTGNWADEWEASGGAWPQMTGRALKTWLLDSWREHTELCGWTMCSEVHMCAGRATAGPGRTERAWRTTWVTGRPRSLCSVSFQSQPLLHHKPPRSTRSQSAPAACDAGSALMHGHASASRHASPGSDLCAPRIKTLGTPYPALAPPHLSRAGPKSGTCLFALIALQHLIEAGGARVASGSAPGVGLASAGKTRGEALQRAVSEAYRRARDRAARSLNGGTWKRGRWHDSQTLQALYRPGLGFSHSRPARRPMRSCTTALRMLSWNTSGLGGGVCQELLAWLEHPDHTLYHLVVLQETHWHQVSDYCSGGWQCIHSSGLKEGSTPDRSSGLLVLLAKAAFCDIATQELHAGRLLHVQAVYKPTGLPITILALYQHVWRTQLTTTENLKLRGAILASIRDILAHTPARHHVILAGDFNACLRPEGTTTHTIAHI